MDLLLGRIRERLHFCTKTLCHTESWKLWFGCLRNRCKTTHGISVQNTRIIVPIVFAHTQLRLEFFLECCTHGPDAFVLHFCESPVYFDCDCVSCIAMLLYMSISGLELCLACDHGLESSLWALGNVSGSMARSYGCTALSRDSKFRLRSWHSSCSNPCFAALARVRSRTYPSCPMSWCPRAPSAQWRAARPGPATRLLAPKAGNAGAQPEPRQPRPSRKTSRDPRAAQPQDGHSAENAAPRKPSGPAKRRVSVRHVALQGIHSGRV